MYSYDETVAALRAAGCVFAEEEAALLLEAGCDLGALIARRVAGEPLEWILGWARFGPLRITVDPGVFVPRRRTEALVAAALASLPEHATVIELCCGSGAISALLLHRRPGLHVYAADIDPVAVTCAQKNLPDATVLEGDLFAPLPASLKGQVHVIVANTPYVPSDEIALMPPEARDHEPRHTLDGGPDGLALLRQIAAEAPAWLGLGGGLLIEVNTGQLDAATAAFRDAGLVASSAIAADGTAIAIGRRRRFETA
jgi:release factor glutamine methyltransferase